MTRWARTKILGCISLMAAEMGCAAHSGSSSTPPSPLLEGLVTLVPHQSPAHWVYHPRTVDVVDMRVSKVRETTVLLTRDGQRWIVDEQGRWSGAEQVAPEPLVAANRGNGEKRFQFLGNTGTVYESHDVLGKFVGVNAPPEEFLRIAAANQVVLGVTTDGQLLRSADGGANWQRVPLASRVADAALLSDGTGLVLTTPEGFAVTRDFGAHLEPVALSTFGATRLQATPTHVRVDGLLGTRAWVPQHPAAWSTGVQERTPEVAAPKALVLRASATALRERRASVDQGRYLEVVQQRGQMKLLRGPVAEALEQTSLGVPSCRSPQLAFGGAVLYLMCGGVPGKVTRLEFKRSQDGGETWSEEPYVAFGDAAMLRTAVLGGDLIVTGICPPETAPAGCAPAGVYRRGSARQSGDDEKELDAKRKVSLVPLAVSGLDGVALDVSVSPSGETLLIAGTRSKNEALVVFSSRDGGRSFHTRELEALAGGTSGSRRRRASTMWLDPTRWGQDGYASLTVVDSKTTVNSLVIVDEHGELVQQRPGPNAAARVAGVGMRALAVDPARATAWESLDGGNEWTPIGPLPVAPCKQQEGDACELDLACHEQGCLIGDALSRVGWKGQQKLPYPAQRQERPAVEIVLKTPLTCRVDEESSWQKVPGGELPDASRAALGDADWFTHHTEWNTASVWSYEMPFDGNGEIRKAALFDAKLDASQWALYVTSQTEGVAALRAPSSGTPVEVAWRDLNRGPHTHHRALPPGSRLSSVATRHLARAGRPGLVSIASGGIFVRLEENEAQSRTLLIDYGHGVTSLPPLSWPTGVASGRTEMVLASGEPLAMKLLRGGAAIAAAALSAGNEWQVSAYTAGLADAADFNLRQSFDLTYVGQRPHYHLRHIGELHSQAWLFPLQAKDPPLGAPIPVPTQRGLLGAGDVCSPEQRTQSPRIVAPPEAQTLHPVIVSHTSEPFPAFITRSAVLHGSTSEPCTAVFEAESVAQNREQSLRALVRPTASQPSWLFKQVAGAEQFEYRRMTCEPDPGAEVPQEVYEVIGR